ncbi:MAG: hypothetical protein ACHQQS_02895 [Thermoanaerobaculales bacterium]
MRRLEKAEALAKVESHVAGHIQQRLAEHRLSNKAFVADTEARLRKCADKIARYEAREKHHGNGGGVKATSVETIVALEKVR